MQKWEYKVVEAFQGRVKTVDGQPLQDGETRLDVFYLNTLGEEGWELISKDVDHEHGGLATVVVFKRPKK